MFGPEALEAILLSLRVSIVATVLALPLAIWVAHVLARKDFTGKVLVDGLVHLPLVLPPVVTGYCLLILFGGNGWLGGFGGFFAFRWTGAALAAAVMAFPLMVRAIRLAIEAVDPGLEDAAQTLGRSRWQVFFAVTLPLSLPGVLAGTVLGFAKALGEFGATITFVAAIPGETQTIPSAIYGLLQVPGGESGVFALVLVSSAFALGALVISEWLARSVKR